MIRHKKSDSASGELSPEEAADVAAAVAHAEGRTPEPAQQAPVDGGGGGGGADPLPPPSFPVGALAIMLTDRLFVMGFGPGAEFSPAERDQAIPLWEAVAEKYAPMLADMGPTGALLTIYAIHTMGVLWTPPKNGSLPAGAGAAKPASSAHSQPNETGSSTGT